MLAVRLPDHMGFPPAPLDSGHLVAKPGTGLPVFRPQRAEVRSCREIHQSHGRRREGAADRGPGALEAVHRA